MYRIGRMIQRDFMNLLINPTWMFFCIMFPFLLIAIIGFMTKGMYGDDFSSYDYYGVTLMVYSGLYSGTFSANSFMEERIKKANLRTIFSPIRQWEIPFSKTIATFLYTTLFYSLVGIVITWLFKINYGSAIVQLWLLFAGVNLVSSSLGVTMCCIFKSEGVANQLLSVLTNLIAISAGLLFPAAAMGKDFANFSQSQPLAKVVQVAFELIYDQNDQHFLLTLLCLLMVSGFLLFAAHLFFKGEEYV